jgi:hypothetical protein
MIAARQIFLGSGAKIPTAADYVQTGLVAMWDGIENIGFSLHSNSTTTWKDLSGNGYDATIISLLQHAYWENDGFRYNKTSLGGNEYYFYVKQPTDIQSRLGNNYTIGFTGKLHPGNNRNYAGFIGDGGDGVRGFFAEAGGSSRIYVQCGNRNGSESGVITFHDLRLDGSSSLDVSISVVCNSGSISAYNNGVHVSSSSGSQALGEQGFAIGASYAYNGDNQGRNPNSNVFFRTPLATINRVWIYDRPLSTNEVANEYAVDKARFNLP